MLHSPRTPLPPPPLELPRRDSPDDPQCGGGPLVNAASGLDLQAPPVPAPPPEAFATVPESIHLGPETTCVPEELLEAPHENDRRRVIVDCAAFLLDRHLRRLVAMRNPLELRLARLLGRFEKSSSPLELGFARASDYVTERLGISGRRLVDRL